MDDEEEEGGGMKVPSPVAANHLSPTTLSEKKVSVSCLYFLACFPPLFRLKYCSSSMNVFFVLSFDGRDLMVEWIRI